MIVHRLASLRVPTRVLTREASRAASLGCVEVVQGTAFSLEDCRRATESCEAVICTVGEHRVPTDGRIVDGEGVINLAVAAEQTGVDRFILVSTLGAGDSWDWLPFIVRGFFHLMGLKPILHEKARSEEYLRSSRLRWTILRPGFLTNARMRSEPVLLPPSGRVPGVTAREAVADVTVRCLRSENGVGQTFTVVDGLMRWAIWKGPPIKLDVPWASWRPTNLQ